jgi:hypothetical protein
MHNFRIPVDNSYLLALGRATYYFSYLEWGIIYLIEKIKPGYVQESQGFVDKIEAKTSGVIAKDFKECLKKYPQTDLSFQNKLQDIANTFSTLVANKRNPIIHGSPRTDQNGKQGLLYHNPGNRGKEGKPVWVEWSEAEILDAALEFQELAIEVNNLFHNSTFESTVTTC